MPQGCRAGGDAVALRDRSRSERETQFISEEECSPHAEGQFERVLTLRQHV